MIFIKRIILFLFRYFIKKNNVIANVGDTVCVSYKIFRHKGKIATVTEIGKSYIEINGINCKYPDKDCSTLKFKDNTIAYNFKSNEYYILNKK